jgi:Tol biopolymer transport system component
VTHDLNNYRSLSITEGSHTLVTVQSTRLSNVWLLSTDDLGQAKQITTGKYFGFHGVAFTPGNKVVHAGQDLDIRLINSDGGDEELLTLEEHNNQHPCVTPDGRYIVFNSFRNLETMNIWRMKIDGSDPIQVTEGVDDRDPDCSPDGRWVVYRSLDSGKPELWRVSIDGGDVVQLTNEVSRGHAISPDGERIACYYEDASTQHTERVIAIIPFEGGKPSQTFDIPRDAVPGAGVHWAHDGTAVTYVVHRNGISNIWHQPVDGGSPTKVTNFKRDRIHSFDWSRDGKYLVCARGVIDNDVVLMENFRRR